MIRDELRNMFLVEPSGKLCHAPLHLHDLFQQSEHRVRDDLQHAPEHVAARVWFGHLPCSAPIRERILWKRPRFFLSFSIILFGSFLLQPTPLFRQPRQVGFTGAQAWDIRLRVFYINQTYMDRWLRNSAKKKYLGWFGPENRHFVLFSAVGYSAKEF